MMMIMRSLVSPLHPHLFSLYPLPSICPSPIQSAPLIPATAEIISSFARSAVIVISLILFFVLHFVVVVRGVLRLETFFRVATRDAWIYQNRGFKSLEGLFSFFFRGFKCLRLANLNLNLNIYFVLPNDRYLSWTELRLKSCQSLAKWLISPIKAFPVRIL